METSILNNHNKTISSSHPTIVYDGSVRGDELKEHLGEHSTTVSKNVYPPLASWNHANKGSQRNANDGALKMITFVVAVLRGVSLSLISVFHHGGGWASTGAVKRGGCATLIVSPRSVMACLRRGVYAYFMTEAGCSKLSTPPGPR